MPQEPSINNELSYKGIVIFILLVETIFLCLIAIPVFGYFFADGMTHAWPINLDSIWEFWGVPVLTAIVGGKFYLKQQYRLSFQIAILGVLDIIFSIGYLYRLFPLSNWSFCLFAFLILCGIPLLIIVRGRKFLSKKLYWLICLLTLLGVLGFILTILISYSLVRF